jgi:hypothetical protein
VHHGEHAHHLGSRCFHTCYHTSPADFCSTTRPASTPASFRTSSLRMNGKTSKGLAGGGPDPRRRPLTTSPEPRLRHPLSPFGSTAGLKKLGSPHPSVKAATPTSLSRKGMSLQRPGAFHQHVLHAKAHKTPVILDPRILHHREMPFRPPKDAHLGE